MTAEDCIHHVPLAGEHDVTMVAYHVGPAARTPRPDAAWWRGGRFAAALPLE